MGRDGGSFHSEEDDECYYCDDEGSEDEYYVDDDDSEEEEEEGGTSKVPRAPYNTRQHGKAVDIHTTPTQQIVEKAPPRKDSKAEIQLFNGLNKHVKVVDLIQMHKEKVALPFQAKIQLQGKHLRTRTGFVQSAESHLEEEKGRGKKCMKLYSKLHFMYINQFLRMVHREGNSWGLKGRRDIYRDLRLFLDNDSDNHPPDQLTFHDYSSFPSEKDLVTPSFGWKLKFDAKRHFNYIEYKPRGADKSKVVIPHTRIWYMNYLVCCIIGEGGYLLIDGTEWRLDKDKVAPQQILDFLGGVFHIRKDKLQDDLYFDPEAEDQANQQQLRPLQRHLHSDPGAEGRANQQQLQPKRPGTSASTCAGSPEFIFLLSACTSH